MLASLILGALVGGYSLPVCADSWKCDVPTVKWDDKCYCEKNGCRPAKEGVPDPFYVCNYILRGQEDCPKDFKCPPLDQCFKAMEKQQ